MVEIFTRTHIIKPCFSNTILKNQSPLTLEYENIHELEQALETHSYIIVQGVCPKIEVILDKCSADFSFMETVEQLLKIGFEPIGGVQSNIVTTSMTTIEEHNIERSFTSGVSTYNGSYVLFSQTMTRKK